MRYGKFRLSPGSIYHYLGSRLRLCVSHAAAAEKATAAAGSDARVHRTITNNG